MIMADSDSSKINRRLLDATTRNTRKRKRFLQLAGLRCPIFLCEFLIIFEDFKFFQETFGAQPCRLGQWSDDAAGRMGLRKLQCPNWNLGIERRSMEQNRRIFEGLKLK
jgi:hypothetical protein